MKKIVAFLLVLAIALGGMVWTHIAVTARQDDLTIYPTTEVGDPSVLEGRSVSLTIGCGEHLRWNMEYPFGGEARTAFTYSRKSLYTPTYSGVNGLDVWFSGGINSSVSGGSIPLAGEYGALLKAVAQETPRNGEKTMSLELSDYVNHYLPEYQLRYEDGSRHCSESAGLYELLNADYPTPGSYVPLMQAFRFPVQPGHTLAVTVQKDDMDQVVGIELYPENGPELHFLSDTCEEGVWFVPIFRDESGAPLPYESPEGHGIYFIPWRHDDLYGWPEGEPEPVTLDVKKAKLCYPLDENLPIRHLLMDAETETARMLTLEDGIYYLTTCDLKTGTEINRLPLLPFAPEETDLTATFLQEGEYLLFQLQDRIALTDAAGEKLLLTAPEGQDLRFGARYFDPATGDLRFDGETLILTDTAWFRESTFWAAAWRQDELTYYGEYDCSLMRSNDHWYYSYVSAEEYPIVLR